MNLPLRFTAAFNARNVGMISKFIFSFEMIPFLQRLKCHSIAFHGIPDGEFGDKVILPSSALAEIQKLEIPMPLLFEVRLETIIFKNNS